MFQKNMLPISTLKMKATGSFKTLVPIYQTTDISPEDINTYIKYLPLVSSVYEQETWIERLHSYKDNMWLSEFT
jgi:hypothetical protein